MTGKKKIVESGQITAVAKGGKWQILVFPGDLIVNRIPETEIGHKLGYKLAAGRVIKSGIPTVREGALVIFGLKDAKEWDLPEMDLGVELSPLGVFQLREGDLRAEIRRVPSAGGGGEPVTIYGQ